MLGIQQTHTAVPHHPTARSAAAAVSAGPLRSSAIPKRRPNGVPKQHVLDTVSTTQDNPETQVEASAENSAWSRPPSNDNVGVEQKDGVNAIRDSGEQGDQQNRSVGPSATQDQVGNGSAEQERKDEREDGLDSKPDGADDYTRRPSSPLSELSPAPDEDDNPTQGEGGGEDEGGEKAASSYSLEGQQPVDGLPDTASSVPTPSDAHATTGQNVAYHGFPGSTMHQATSMKPFTSDLPTGVHLPASSASLGSSSQLPYTAGLLPSSSPGNKAVGIAYAGPSGAASPNSAKGDTTRKFSILLELNAELFKVCQVFMSSGYSLQESPEAQPFSKRLDSNLTWMSTQVDHANQAHVIGPSVPDVDPPVLAPSAAHIPFPEGIFGRINSIYAQLATIFAKDIARRNLLPTSSPNSGIPNSVRRSSSTPSILPPSGIGVKRERPDSGGYSRMESPSAPKRRDTGEGKEYMGPSTPTRATSLSVGDMPPPASGFSTPSHPQMARPGSGMSGTGPVNVSGHSDGMFSPSTSSGLNISGSMQGPSGLSPDAQVRARQLQQAQAMMLHHHQLQQQQGQQRPQINQQQQNMPQIGTQNINIGISSPQRLSQGTPSPTRQQQLMQAQAVASRQMSPSAPGLGTGMGMGMGMNGSDSVGSSQQSGVGSNIPQANMGANVNGMNTNAGSNMTQNQMLASMGPAAVAMYQALQNAQHPITNYLNQQMPNFSQLPVMEQMRRFQMVQRQMSQRNQMMANQMMGGQMRQPSIGSSGSGAPQLQHLGQSGQLGMAPQVQASTPEASMQFPSNPGSGNLPGAASSMGMSQLSNVSGMPNVQNVANLNPQQRQLYLMQMQQMRNGGVASSNGGGMGGGMNPALVNPQLMQERQRLDQQQRLALAQRHGSPLNPASSSGSGQFPSGLRSNPTPSVGISRTGRSPSVSGLGDMAGAATPRIGGRMLPGSEDYQRQVLIQQAQRSAQLQQQQGFMQGQGQGSWQGQQPQLPLSAGAWPQQTQQGFGMGGSPPNTGMPGVDFMTPSRQASSTPAPVGHQSPTAPSTDFDNMMNW